MALQYTRGSEQAPIVSGGQQPATASDVETFDIVEKRQEMASQLVGSQEVDDIVSSINVNEPSTIVTFGKEAAEEISKCSDLILKSINMSQVNDTGEMLVTLGKIMDKFDIQEIAEEPKKGFFGKMVGKMQKQIDQILAKYHTMGEEVDKIYVQLKQYENEILGSNEKLNMMFKSNIGYYQMLVKYIFAGEQGLKEIEAYLVDMKKEYEQTQDAMLKFDIDNLEQARIILEQRTQDLRIAENVAMQSLPMIKSMQYGNLNLVRKINSAFIITLPVFKQALTQAVLLKRQKIQAQAMQALDERTNEMLLKNAQNTAEQSKLTAQLASSSSVKVETLEQTWQTIVQGIDETKQIEQQAKLKREEDAKRLAAIKEQYKSKFGV